MRDSEFGQLDPEQHMLVIKTVGQWIRQAKEAWDELEASCGTDRQWRLAEMQPRNPAAFSRFVEAYYALFPDKVDDDMIRLAGLVPVDQAVLGG